MLNDDLPSSSDSLKILTEVRQATLLSSFLEALTRGGPGGLPRPIELHAHDPTRYVGDMLAWVHQAMAGEREFLESLFGIKGDNRMVGSVRKARDTEEEEYVAKLMDGDLEKLSMPLRVPKNCFLDRSDGLECLTNSIFCDLGSSPSNSQVAGREHHVVQDCQPASILSAHGLEDHWRRGLAFKNTERVRY